MWFAGSSSFCSSCFFEIYGDHRVLHVLTHAFPTLLSSDLGGLSVRTTLDPRRQGIAERVLREGLIAYDRRHGWRGPLQAVPVGEGADVAALLQQIERPAGISDTWQLAAVLATDARQADIILADGSSGHIPMAEMTWARKWIEGQRTGYAPDQPGDGLRIGRAHV